MFQRILVIALVLSLTYGAMTFMIGKIADSISSSATMIAQATQGAR